MELQIPLSLEKNRPFLRDLQGVKFTEALCVVYKSSVLLP